MKKLRLLLLLLALAVALSSVVAVGVFAAVGEGESSSLYEYVVVLGVDGMGNFNLIADTPNMDAIFEGGATTDRALVENPSASAQGWGSLLTGFTCDVHGFTNNSIGQGPNENDAIPTIFKLLKDQRPEAQAVSYCCWNTINNGIVENIDGVVKEYVKDENMGTAVDGYVAENGVPNLLFCQFNYSDSIGHNSGYATAEHLQCISDTDKYIGNVYNVYKEAGVLDKTLFIVTTDHGGINTSHGGWTNEEKFVFYGVAGEGVNETNELDMYIRDTAAIVCYALGIEGTEGWDSYVPQNLFVDNMTPIKRPPAAPELIYPNATPSEDDEKYIGNFIDVDALKAGFFFDGDLANFVEGSDVELGRYVGAFSEKNTGIVYYPQGLWSESVRLSYEGYLATDDLKLDNNSFSIGLWLKPDDMIHRNHPVWATKNYSETDGIAGEDQQGVILRNINLNSNRYLGYSFGGGIDGKHINYNGDENSDYDLGEWVHTLMTVDRDAGTVKYYVNFVLVKTVKLSSYSWFTADFDIDPYDVFALGQDATGAYTTSYEGSVDDLLIWNTAVDSATVANLKAYYDNAFYDYDYYLVGESTVSTTHTDEVEITESVTNTDNTPYVKMQARVLGEKLASGAKYQLSSGLTLSDYTKPSFYIVDFDISTESQYLPMNFFSQIFGSIDGESLETPVNRITADGALVGALDGHAVTRTLSTAPFDWQHITLVYDLVEGDDGYPLYIYYNGTLISNAEWMSSSAKTDGEVPAFISGMTFAVAELATSEDYYATTMIANAKASLYTDDEYGNLCALFSSGASMLKSNKIFGLVYGSKYSLPESDYMFSSGEVLYRDFADALANGNGTVDVLHNDYYNTHPITAPCTVNTNGNVFRYELTDAVRFKESTDEGGNNVYLFVSNTPLYEITVGDTVTKYYEAKTLNELLVEIPEGASTIKLYEDINIDANYDLKKKTVNLELNKHKLTNTGGYVRVYTGAVLNISGGDIEYSKNLFYTGNGASGAVISITDCHITQGTSYLADFRTGTLNITRCIVDDLNDFSRFINVGSGGGANDYSVVKIDGCTMDIGAAALIYSKRSSSYPAALKMEFTITDSEIKTTGKLFHLENTTAGVADSITDITVNGNSRISAAEFEGGGAISGKTTLTLGLGAVFTVEPAISGVTTVFCDGATRVVKTEGAEYPYSVEEPEPEEENYLYKITFADGNEVKYYEEMSLQTLVALAVASDGSIVTLNSNIDLSESTACAIATVLTIDLNGFEITNTGERLRVNAGGKLTLINGTLNDCGTTVDNEYKDKDFIYIPRLADTQTAEVIIDNCDIIANGYVIDICSGSVTVKNGTTFVQGGKKAAPFAYMLPSGSRASLTVEDSEIDLGDAPFINSGRSSSYPGAAHFTVSVTDSTVKTEGNLLYLKNTTDGAVTSSIKIFFAGESYLKYANFEGSTNGVTDTTVTFAKGVKVSSIPVLGVGVVSFADGAKEFVSTDDVNYPYMANCLLYTVTQGGVAVNIYDSKVLEDLLAMVDAGGTITLFSDIETATDNTIIEKSYNINLNGNTLTNTGGRIRVSGNSQVYIYGGTLVDVSSKPFFFAAISDSNVVYTIDDCTVTTSNSFAQLRNGKLIINNSRVSGGAVAEFQTAGKNGAVEITGGSVVNLGASALVSIREYSANTSSQVNKSVKIIGSTVNTTGSLVSFVADEAFSDDSVISLEVLGSSKLSFEFLDGGKNSFAGTTFNFGLGVKMSNVPALNIGNVIFNDGAEGISLTDDAIYKYEVVETVSLPVRPQFALTLYTDFTINLCFGEDDISNVISVKVGDTVITPVKSGKLNIYRIDGIAPQAAATKQQIELTVYNYGVPVVKTIEYSVMDYANTLLRSDYSTESKEMVCRAIDFVKSVCEYAAVEVPADVTAFIESDAYGAISKAENVTEVPAGNISIDAIKPFIKSAQLKITKTGIFFRFFLQENIGSGELKASSKTYKNTFTVADSLIETNNEKNNYFDVNLRAYDFYDGAIVLTYGNNTGSYDFKTYANSVAVKNSNDPLLAPLVLATYNYFREAQEYFLVRDKDFKSNAEVVVKDGKSGTVSYTVDDGFASTATLLKSMLADYENLKLTFALIPGTSVEARNLVNLTTAADEYGKLIYVFDENGKYTYTVNEENAAFWQNILSGTNGRIELSSHSLTHSYPGANNNGGIFKYVNDGEVVEKELPVGSVTAELYAARQVLNDLFGVDVLTLVEPGVQANEEDVTVDGVLYEGYYEAYYEIVKQMYDAGLLVGGRGIGHNDPTRVVTHDNLINGYDRLRVSAYTIRQGQSADDWKAYVDNATDVGGWAFFCIHQVVPTSSGTLQMSETEARELFSYTNRGDIWVSTYEEACKYYAEWSTAEVSSICLGDSVLVTLTDGEDNTLYDEALTVKVTVPSSWKNCEVNGKALEVKTDEDGSKFVYVDILPDSGTVEIIEK